MQILLFGMQFIIETLKKVKDHIKIVLQLCRDTHSKTKGSNSMSVISSNFLSRYSES